MLQSKVGPKGECVFICDFLHANGNPTAVERYGVTSLSEYAYLFGSRATGNAHLRSDVDGAVYLEDHGDLFKRRLDLMGVLSRHLGTDAVDVIVLNDAPISLAGRVLQSRKVLLDRDPPRRHEYESRTIREFHDFRIQETRLLDRWFARG